MLIVIITVILASIAFGREATRAGCDRGRAIRFPILLGALIFVVESLMSLTMRWIFNKAGTTSSLADAIFWIGNLFFVVLFVALVGKNWRILRRLPDRVATHHDVSPEEPE